MVHIDNVDAVELASGKGKGVYIARWLWEGVLRYRRVRGEECCEEEGSFDILRLFCFWSCTIFVEYILLSKCLVLVHFQLSTRGTSK